MQPPPSVTLGKKSREQGNWRLQGGDEGLQLSIIFVIIADRCLNTFAAGCICTDYSVLEISASAFILKKGTFGRSNTFLYPLKICFMIILTIASLNT